MTDKEIMDKEIIKGLERMSEEDPCGFSSDVLDLINRLQAENNTLKYQVNRLKKYDERRDIALHSRLIAEARAEAIKEFADKLREKMRNEVLHIHLYPKDIDDMVKELIGEEK